MHINKRLHEYTLKSRAVVAKPADGSHIHRALMVGITTPPKYLDALRAKGLAFEKLKRYEDAISCYNSVLEKRFGIGYHKGYS